MDPEYTTEIVPMHISKALVMFKIVIFSVAHSRVVGNTTFLFYSYPFVVV
jgi:hypothetical protein